MQMVITHRLGNAYMRRLGNGYMCRTSKLLPHTDWETVTNRELANGYHTTTWKWLSHVDADFEIVISCRDLGCWIKMVIRS